MEKNRSERLRIEVDCSASASSVPEPRRIHAGHAVYDVVVVDRWHEGPRRAGDPARRYFKVCSRGGCTFLIVYDENATAWFLVKSFGPEIPIAT